MARGMLAGITTGLVVAVLGLGTASLVLPPAVQPPAPSDTAAPEASAPSDTAAPEDAVAPDAGAAAPDVAETAPQDPDAADAADAPQATDAAGVPADADMPADSDDTAPEPVAEPDAATPEVPAASAGADGAEDAAAPPASADTAPAAPAPTGAPEPDATPAAAPEPDATPADAPEPDATPAEAPEPDPAAAPRADSPRDDAGPAEPAPEQPARDDAAVPDDASAPEVAAVPDAAAVPEDVAGPDDAAAPEVGPGVVTGRLPSIGGDPAGDAGAAAPVPALVRNAMDFEITGEQPLLSILLIDTGGDRSGMADLGKLPFPVTVAIDAGATDAAEAAAFYRAQGAEVVVSMPLPEGATPTDVDVSFEAYAPLLEPAVAVMMEEALGFQVLGDGAAQVGVNLAETGHGLISFPAGLNTGHKAAMKEGVQAGLVFSDLDGEGQAGAVIRRFLDNAAFRARNENGVIVVGRTRPETVQALLEWSLGTRAETVTLVPVSVFLLLQ